MIKAILAGAFIYMLALVSVILIVNHLDISIEVKKIKDEESEENMK